MVYFVQGASTMPRTLKVKIVRIAPYNLRDRTIHRANEQNHEIVQHKEPEPMETTASSSPSSMLNTIMSDLNDDAIMEILRRMSLDELTSISATSHRFQTLARAVFKRNFASECVQVESWSIANKHGQGAIAHVIRLFRTFGAQMTKINLSLFYSHLYRLNVVIYNLMVKHCTNVIDKFTFHSYSFYPKPNDLINARPFFRQVKELHLYSFDPLTVDSLSECKQLTNIKIEPGVSAQLFDNYYPKLKKIELPGSAISASFFARHRNLIEIVARCAILPLSLVARMLRLERLTMTDLYGSDGLDIIKLSKLKYLKTLQLHSCVIKDEVFGRFLRQSASTDSMECMEIISYCELDFDGIERFKNLRELELCGKWSKTFTAKDLERLEQLVHLEKLVVNCSDMDIEPERLLTFIRTMKNLQKLVVGAKNVNLIQTNL